MERKELVNEMKKQFEIFLEDKEHFDKTEAKRIIEEYMKLVGKGYVGNIKGMDIEKCDMFSMADIMEL